MNAIELIGTASVNNGTARMTYTPKNDDSGVYEARYIGEQIGQDYYLTSTSEAVDVLVDNHTNLTYQLNGGSLANADHQNQFTIRMNKALPTPTRDGYAFDGWYLDPSFKTPATRVAQGTDKDVTVYAKWRVSTAKGVSADASGFDNKDSADNGNNGGKDNNSIVPSGINNTNGANGINHEF